MQSSSTALNVIPAPGPGEASPANMAEAVYAEILECIIRGTLLPGTVLSAVKWSEKLAVSRTPVHEALRMLAADGLVENPAGRRAQVASFTRDDLWEIFEMRRLLEGPAAERAAGRLDGRQLEPLRKAAEGLANSDLGEREWTELWSNFDQEFHAAIAAHCGNERLANDINRYRLIHRGFNRVTAEVTSLQQALAEHLAILEALEARDGRAARAAMEEHITNWQHYFVEHYQADR